MKFLEWKIVGFLVNLNVLWFCVIFVLGSFNFQEPYDCYVIWFIQMQTPEREIHQWEWSKKMYFI